MMRIDDEGALQAERISRTGGGASEQVGAQRRAVGSVYWGCPGHEENYVQQRRPPVLEFKFIGRGDGRGWEKSRDQTERDIG